MKQKKSVKGNIFIIFILVYVLLLVSFIFVTSTFEKNNSKSHNKSDSLFENEFPCANNLDSYINYHNLDCDMNSITSTLVGNKYKCCRVCYVKNPNGSDYTHEICKFN